ncbi:YitT family protein [Vibrio sp. SCSIO 43136]|uniref:YitT family protein n=1 Tax=Vibrio sp. SCSIO 43136 TaxID=2819101 RepID=UPI002075A924|nr:YitT family protein [Vibrio sp. SCSIO 43136]USD64670.1 YitT family protein [Vibrio sp. SCSIO 43136]
MEKHTQREDWIAIFTGTFIVAQGVYFLQAGDLLTGGTTGLALLMTHFLPFSFGTLYFVSNLPFYMLAWKRFGARFAFTSLVSGALVSVMADFLPQVLSIESVNPIYCALIGGILMGLGMLILFRHRTSLGGFNVLCLLIQDKTGFSVGKSQMLLDACILIASCFFVSPETIAISVLGALMLNIVLAMNHKPTRYIVKYS